MDLDAFDVEIIGADIDRRVLEAANRGVYAPSSTRHLSTTQMARYFTPAGDGRARVSEELRGAIHFTYANLIDAQGMAAFREFDLIFCRNVLIYFDDKTRQEAVENLYDTLRPGGFIFLGHSESMSRISSLFTPRRFPDALAYQRAA